MTDDYEFFMRMVFWLGDLLCLCATALIGQLTMRTMKRWDREDKAAKAAMESEEESEASEQSKNSFGS